MNPKIIQILSHVGNLYALMNDGKLYLRYSNPATKSLIFGDKPRYEWMQIKGPLDET